MGQNMLGVEKFVLRAGFSCIGERKRMCFGRRKEAESVVEREVRFVPSSPEWALHVLLGKGVVSESVESAE